MVDTLSQLKSDYEEVRQVEFNQEQFVYLLNLFPALLVVLSDGIVDREEWVTVKKLAKILGSEFASDDYGQEKEENLTLVYRAEFKYLLNHRDEWEERFLKLLKEYFRDNPGSKSFVVETMHLFANASDGMSSEEMAAIQNLSEKLDLEPFF